MSYQNISAVLSKEDMDYILTRIKEIEAKLSFAVNLTPKEILSLMKMGDLSEPFVEKSLEYAQRNPQLVPGFLDLEEFANDLELAKKLKKISRRLAQLEERVKDTGTAVGSEAFKAALVFLQSIKAAVKNNVPGTGEILQDLSKRFQK